MENNLKIALIQTDNIWENIPENLKSLSKKINTIHESVDIIVLPELFSTGFTMSAKPVAESMSGKAIHWMLEKASNKKSLIIGSLIISENKNIYNRLIVAFPNGEIKYYDKRHLFSFAGEEKVFSAGKKKLIFEYKGFKICPLICYDLRFPVWARNTEKIDLLIYIANWPNARISAWDTLLKARAIENLCYVIGVNRVGVDNNKLVYTGHSTVIDALGKIILEFKERQEDIKTTTLQKDQILDTRNKFHFLDDRDVFEIK
ncbi:MAG: amidohydrolase [Flavobacteriaceae bacterium]|nr:amidohydrolase [Flavobacteriaceae bacterium]